MAEEGGSKGYQKIISMAQIFVRVLAAAFSIAAFIVLLSSSQTVMVQDYAMVIHYNDISAMRFLFAADIIACIFSVLSLLCVFLLSRSKSSIRNDFLLFIHDMVIMLVLMSGCSAALAISYLGKYGEAKAFWSPVCDIVHKFCSRASVSLVLSVLALISFLILTIMSSIKLMSRPIE